MGCGGSREARQPQPGEEPLPPPRRANPLHVGKSSGPAGGVPRDRIELPNFHVQHAEANALVRDPPDRDKEHGRSPMQSERASTAAQRSGGSVGLGITSVQEQQPAPSHQTLPPSPPNYDESERQAFRGEPEPERGGWHTRPSHTRGPLPPLNIEPLQITQALEAAFKEHPTGAAIRRTEEAAQRRQAREQRQAEAAAQQKLADKRAAEAARVGKLTGSGGDFLGLEVYEGA